jgi:hypothetical protein
MHLCFYYLINWHLFEQLVPLPIIKKLNEHYYIGSGVYGAL